MFFTDKGSNDAAFRRTAKHEAQDWVTARARARRLKRAEGKAGDVAPDLAAKVKALAN